MRNTRKHEIRGNQTNLSVIPSKMKVNNSLITLKKMEGINERTENERKWGNMNGWDMERVGGNQ